MKLILGFLFAILPGVALAAADRVALVVGMAQYETVVSLDNTLNDARGVAQALEGIGFSVTTLENATAEQFRDAVQTFAFQSETADLALVYFAGHGIEVQGENYLIPVDAAIASNQDVQRQSVSLKELLAAVEGARKMRIVILDSCRDNPFGDALDIVALQETAAAAEQTRSAGGGGLAPVEPDVGIQVAFAAKAGERALDGGSAGNSPFALALMRNLPQPGLEIGQMFRLVRDDVLKATGNRQEPYTYGSLPATLFYVAGNADAEVEQVDPVLAWSTISPEQETQYAALAEEGDTRSLMVMALMRLNPKDSRYEPRTAAEYLTRAADAGNPEAQWKLGQLYEKGTGVPVDQAKALELYLAAAGQDYPRALNDLGVIYFNGELGVERDPAKGLDYMVLAADLRQEEAMFNVAAMIDDGALPGKGATEAADYLYQTLRAGSRDALNLLQTKPTMFKPETRMALQVKLTEKGFYSGPIDGDFGRGTQKAIAAAFGLI